MNIQDKIRTMREINQWTQEEMAEKLAMSVNSYSKLERGVTRLNLEKLEQIATIFNIDLLELLANKNGGVFFVLNDKLDNINTNYYNGNADIELEKLQLILKHKDELLAQKEKENEMLRKMVALLEQKNAVSE